VFKLRALVERRCKNLAAGFNLCSRSPASLAMSALSLLRALLITAVRPGADRDHGISAAAAGGARPRLFGRRGWGPPII
jgi:hypothetical protein